MLCLTEHKCYVLIKLQVCLIIVAKKLEIFCFDLCDKDLQYSKYICISKHKTLTLTTKKMSELRKQVHKGGRGPNSNWNQRFSTL